MTASSYRVQCTKHLIKVVAALHAGKAVTIAPQTMKLTTQQAADLLGVDLGIGRPQRRYESAG